MATAIITGTAALAKTWALTIYAPGTGIVDTALTRKAAGSTA
jgi:hypothetical protein